MTAPSPMTSLDASRALAWRLHRHGLDAPSADGAAEVAERVLALRAWPHDLAELAIGIRSAHPAPGALARALETGEVVAAYALRGGSTALTPSAASVLLRVRATTRVWETARYQRQGRFALEDWAPLRESVRRVLADGPRTRAEISAHLARDPALRHLAEAATGIGADSLYKPLHWWGDICFGPPRDGTATFRLVREGEHRPEHQDLDEAGPEAVRLYLAAYGPATEENLLHFLAEGLSAPRRRVLGWLADLGDEVTTVQLTGPSNAASGSATSEAQAPTQTPSLAYVLTADLDRITATEPTDAVRLVPGFDPWIMGPGTADPRLLAPARRALASRGAHLMLRGGVVTGTWRRSGDALTIDWFPEAGLSPRALLEDEARRVAGVVAAVGGAAPDRDLRITITDSA